MKRGLLAKVTVAALGIALIGGGAAIGATLGIAMSNTSKSASADEASSPGVPESTASLQFETNEHGQTVGDYGVGLRDDPGADPELIRAVGEDGTEGYVYTEQVFGSPAATPEDAVKKSELPIHEKTVPLYARDGETVVGKYIANAGY